MKTRLLQWGLFCLLLMAAPNIVSGNPGFKIALLLGPDGETLYHRQTVQEIGALLENRVQVEYLRVVLGPDQENQANEVLQELMGNDSIDCIIGIGIDQSEFLVRLKQYDKPTIAATILDRRLQGLPLTTNGTSGIRNFNYIQSPFDIEKDLKTFRSLYAYRHLAVLLPPGKTIMPQTVINYFNKAVKKVSPGAKLSMVEIDPERIEESVASIRSDVDAVYLLPLYPEASLEREKELIRAVNRRQLPSFAMVGEHHVRMGAMAAIAPDRNFNAMTRRIAINVLEILDGRDAGTLPVTVTPYADNFVVNVETFRDIDYYPEFKAVQEARLLNLDKLHQGPKLGLKRAILEALAHNLDLQMEKADTEIQAGEAKVAQSALLPQVDLSSSLTRVDENQVLIARTVGARTTWSATASLRQTLFSDDLLANHAIQKILLDSQNHQEKAVRLDTVVTAAQAYITLLSARSNQAIQNNNLEVTRKNLDIARNKAAVGAVDASEVNRWESEKASNQIRLNDAYRDLQLARMSLNQLLNRPITREFTPLEIEPDSAIELLVTDPAVYRLVGNFKQLARFGDFLVAEADKNLPEIKQIAANLRSEERRLLNRQRAVYLPDVTLSGGVDKILGETDTGPGTPSAVDHPWNISLTAAWPLYAGGTRKEELALSRMQLRRIRMAEKDLRNRLHLNVRANLETAAVSAREIELAESARLSAQKSFDIVQAGYAEGRNRVTDLVDAQNAKMTSELSAALSRYQFVIDMLNLERSLGRFHFLDSPEKKQDFLNRLGRYMQVK